MTAVASKSPHSLKGDHHHDDNGDDNDHDDVSHNDDGSEMVLMMMMKTSMMTVSIFDAIGDMIRTELPFMKLRFFHKFGKLNLYLAVDLVIRVGVKKKRIATLCSPGKQKMIQITNTNDKYKCKYKYK